MSDKTISENTQKAIAYLQTLFKEKRINLVAINDDAVIGITTDIRPLSPHPSGSSFENNRLSQFIEHHNGKSNIYYSVNTPADDAPNAKLKKEHIKEINAVWIDADPVKCPEGADAKEHFAQERKRLHKFAEDLMKGENPPTVITDSGGGIQAFWWLDKPIPVTDDTRQHYEALSRGLADQYGTDKVHNIDRIMRLPYTWNIPGAKKKGRTKTFARCTRIGKRYSGLGFITPSEADDVVNDIDYTKLDMEQVKLPMSNELHAKLVQLRKRNQKIDDLWTNKIDMKPSRSERDFTLAKELKGEGCTLLETAQLMWIYPHGKNTQLTAREIIRCYERSGNDFIGMDQETIDRIAKQVNPLTVAQEKITAFINGAQFIWGADATRANSGTPLFKHFLNRETVNVLFGPSGSGKSFLTLDMAMHLATGKDWAGFKCKQQMAVLYICTESGSSFGKRAEAARSRVGIKAGASPQEFPFAYYPAHVDLLTNKDHLKLIAKLVDDLERMSGHKCGLIIVDTLSAAFGGGNENSEDMTKFVNNMASLKFAKHAAILVVHHTGKDESAGARGHSSLKGNVDTEIQVRSEKRGDKYYRSFSSTKQKDDETGKTTRFGLQIIELGKDEDGDPITTCTVILEGDNEFANMVPSIEDELDVNALAALQAIRYYDKAISNPNVERNFSHTEHQAKAVIFNDILKGNKLVDASNEDKSLMFLNVMSLPSPSVLKAFGRACDILKTKGMVHEGRKYQLVGTDENC